MSFSQIDARGAFFRNVSGSTGNLSKIDASVKATATMVDTTPSLITAGTAYATGTILRDMGKTVTVVNAAGQALLRYRSVRIVNGLNSEGTRVADVGADTEYVLVWAASGSGVNFARLG